MIRRIIWAIIRYVYIGLIKPILFLLPPDSVHARTIKKFAYMGRIGIFRSLVRIVFKRRPNKMLTQAVAGVQFVSPVGLSAGFDKNGEVVPIISNLGFGFGEVGSVTAEVCKGNPRPWFYRLPKTKSLVVYAGLANHGSKVVLKRLLATKTIVRTDYPVILSIAKTNVPEVVTVDAGIEDYITTIQRAKRNSAVQFIEINISCPNTFGGEPFTSPDRLAKLLTAIDKAGPTQPVLIKMPSDLAWDKYKQLLDVIVKHKVIGVTIANLAKDRTKVNLQDELPDAVRGNLSGKPAQAISDELVRRTYLAYGDKLTIIGVGGIFSADDAYRKIRLGASLVELITGLIFYGPQLASEINDGLAMRLTRDGFSHISQVVGVDAGDEVDHIITTT